MASSIWTISVAGGAYVSFESLGIRAPVIEKASLEVGSLKFTVPVRDISAAAPFAYGQQLVIKRAGVIFFIGRVRVVAANFSQQGSSWSIAAYDSWWELERTVYRQAAVVYDATGLLKIGLMSTRLTLNQDQWGNQLTQAQQLANILAYAGAMNPGIISYGASALSAQWPREETRDITAAEAVRRAASLTPSEYSYPTYSTGTWKLNWAARAGLTLVTIDLAAADQVLDVNGLSARSDAVPPGVVFDFFYADEDGDGAGRVRYNRQAAGAPGPAGTIYATFNLSSCDTVPAGAAAAYYAALSATHYEGTIRLAEAEVTGTVMPGCRLRIANGQPGWAAMDAVVQRCSYDLDSGVTTVELAPSDVLGVDEFVAQLNRFRNRPASTGFCATQNNGTEGVSGAVDDNNAAITPGTEIGDEGPGIAIPPAAQPGVPEPTPNPDSGTPVLPAVFPFIDLEYCKGTSPRLARLVGFDIGPAP